MINQRYLDLEIERFSALQRAEIAEIYKNILGFFFYNMCFSALQRAEIAEIFRFMRRLPGFHVFQCSSTSRNC